MLSGASSTGRPQRVPVRVRVCNSRVVLRPTVGLMVETTCTLHDVLVQAMCFKDHYTQSEHRVQEIIGLAMDVVCSNSKTQDTGEEVHVAANTLVADAMCFGDFDRVVFTAMEALTVRFFGPLAYLIRMFIVWCVF